MFAEQLAHVRQRILQACLRVGRAPSDITLIGVTKGHSAAVIQEVVAHGLLDVGENRVQEAQAKQVELGVSLRSQVSGLRSVRWHLIGHLQRNKAKLAVELFDVIHSVDSQALIEELERHAANRQAQGASLKAQGYANLDPCTLNLAPLQVLLQVNVSGEATKFGCAPEAALPLAQAIQRCARLQLVGLMTIAPFGDNPEASRPHFRRLRELRDALALSLHLEPCTLKLSMGMSQDFEVAIEEGADYVRLGTVLFGARST